MCFQAGCRTAKQMAEGNKAPTPARSEEAEKPDKDEKAPVTPEQALGGALVHCASQKFVGSKFVL